MQVPLLLIGDARIDGRLFFRVGNQFQFRIRTPAHQSHSQILNIKGEIGQLEGFGEAAFDSASFVNVGASFFIQGHVTPNALVGIAQRILHEQVRIPQLGMVQRFVRFEWDIVETWLPPADLYKDVGIELLFLRLDFTDFQENQSDFHRNPVIPEAQVFLRVAYFSQDALEDTIVLTLLMFPS